MKPSRYPPTILGDMETNIYVKSGWKSQQVRKRDREIDPRRAAKAQTKEDEEAAVILSLRKSGLCYTFV